MSKRRKGRKTADIRWVGIITLPFKFIFWWLRAILSVRHGRFTPGLVLAIGLLLCSEGLGLGLALQGANSTLNGAVITVSLILTVTWFVLLVRIFRHRNRLRIQRFESLLALTPSQFEGAIAELIHDLGYRDVRKVGRAGDLGADIVCRDKAGRRVVVQCKRHAPGIKVGSGDVQAFIGMMAVHHEAERGIFVTTSTFTAPATALASQHGIRVIDGQELSRLVTALRSGADTELALVRDV